MNDKRNHRFRDPPRLLTINGGSSSIEFALLEVRGSLRQILEGRIARSVCQVLRLGMAFDKGKSNHAKQCILEDDCCPRLRHAGGRSIRATRRPLRPKHTKTRQMYQVAVDHGNRNVLCANQTTKRSTSQGIKI